MMSNVLTVGNVLTVEQREQAGSDSYNRFEYQVHWIVCHIIDRENKNLWEIGCTCSISTA